MFSFKIYCDNLKTHDEPATSSLQKRLKLLSGSLLTQHRSKRLRYKNEKKNLIIYTRIYGECIANMTS